MASGLVCLYLFRNSVGGAEALLERADKLAWNNDWVEADPLYEKAESLLTTQHLPSKALYAHVSRFILRAESEPISSLLVELQRDETRPDANGPDTHLRILLIEGMLETNYDAGMARKTWEQVETIALRRGRYRLAARAVGEQGIAAFLQGDVASAGRLVRIAWITARCLHDQPAHVRYASVYGAGLVELQQYESAMRVLDEAINTATSSRSVAYPSIAMDSKIDALRGLHRYSDALELADEAIARLPSSTLDAHVFQILTSKGKVYGDINQWNQASHVYERALAYARHLEYWRGIAETGGLLAVSLEHEEKLPDALKAVDEAIHANEEQPDELYYAPRNLAIKAEILDRMGRSHEAHSLYERSLTLIDSLVATAPTPEVERDLITQLGVVYTSYYRSLAGEGDLAGAFEVVERERGRVEAHALEDHALVLPHPISPVEQKISDLNVKLIESDEPAITLQLEEALRTANLSSDNTTLAMRAARRPFSVASVQNHLESGELVLEYVLAEPTSSVLAITRGSVHKYDLPSKQEIELDARHYEATMRRRSADRVLASRLFSELLAPVPEYRSNPALIVIPDGQLHLLPFSALMANNAYVLTTHTVSASPSATVLSLLRDREQVTSSDPLSYVGVAAWSAMDEQEEAEVRSVSLRAPTPDFEPLPESKQEVEEIAGDFPEPNTLLIGPDATETRFKQLPLMKYRVLHLALHGYADLEFPDRSALVFSPESDGPDDGRLEIREIRNLRLRARLVALSSCNTGVGPIGASDIANVSNAFIEAGAETVVSTLWELQDRTAEHLMTDFYQKLAQHHEKGAALREAQLDFVRADLSPYYWAGFEVVGDPSGTL
ncbi:CHAT domain-containing protein [Acidicapsa ligni]|uniref:CHAT domain-containing protein n=1 Tax=Acidicapsa ligni TaxID=542300 RepID=UPI0021E0B45C|nr:CHAT domain-containing protein [Acidicapsa ligni]